MKECMEPGRKDNIREKDLWNAITGYPLKDAIRSVINRESWKEILDYLRFWKTNLRRKYAEKIQF